MILLLFRSVKLQVLEGCTLVRLSVVYLLEIFILRVQLLQFRMFRLEIYLLDVLEPVIGHVSVFLQESEQSLSLLYQSKGDQVPQEGLIILCTREM